MTYVGLTHLRCSREEKGGKVSLFFDCNGAGLSNLDIEFMQFQISIMEQYIPDKLNYILVFNMPWVLNGKKLGFFLSNLTFFLINEDSRFPPSFFIFLKN